jgi:acetolactate synthase-1/2/3 large subunit
MVYQNLQGNLFLEGHVSYSLARLIEAIRALGFDKAKVDARRSHWRAQHDKLQAEYREIERKAGEGKTIDPVTACRIIGETLPRNSVYVDETTTHRDVIRCHVPFFGPQSHYKVPGGLGQGLGVALGVKLAMPNRPVVSLIGDGAFLYNPAPQSLGLSADAKLPILIIVFNNRGYRAMKRNHLSYYPDGVSAENKNFLGETIHGPNFGELAKPFGGVGFRVEQAVDLKPTLQSAMKAVDAGQTAIVDLLVN